MLQTLFSCFQKKKRKLKTDTGFASEYILVYPCLMEEESRTFKWGHLPMIKEQL